MIRAGFSEPTRGTFTGDLGRIHRSPNPVPSWGGGVLQGILTLATPECQEFVPSLAADCSSEASSVGSFPPGSSHCVSVTVYTFSWAARLSEVFVAPEAEESPL